MDNPETNQRPSFERPSTRRQRLRATVLQYRWLTGALAAVCVILAVVVIAAPPGEDQTRERPADVTHETETADTFNLGTGLAGVAEDVGEEQASESDDPATAGSEAGREIAVGEASYYGGELAGRPTASGEQFDPGRMTAAHRTLPFGTKVRVTNLRNNRSVVVRVNDRGPFVRRRVIDLSEEAARRIGMLGSGHARVRLQVIH